ncbi:glycosyltransferase family 2 protein [Candidatus Gottesmanbacteria bacterium]|nr:glycosyltransferase family 2 protein [Candidatus Gottesmanbacteria bacterium]
MKISAVILTKNEEKNIEKCLESLFWCDEIIIVDDYSEDQTLKKIKDGIKVYQRHVDSDFALQRNFGLEKATSDWVLFVDADEVISDELAKEIIKATSTLSSRVRQSADVAISEIASSKSPRNDNLSGFYIPRKDYIFGKLLKYGETGNIKFIRLAKKGSGLWEGRVHEVWKINGIVKGLRNPILHYPHQSIFEFLNDINWYTDLVAQYWKEEGRKISFWEIIVYPVGKFIQNYIFRLGFLDGTAGLVLAVFMSFHSFSARSKYWLMNNRK